MQAKRNGRETAECSQPWRVCQQSIAFHVVLSVKVQIAASCCKIVAHLWTYHVKNKSSSHVSIKTISLKEQLMLKQTNEEEKETKSQKAQEKVRKQEDNEQWPE